MSKHVLKVKGEYNSRVFGINTTFKDFKLAHFLNKELDIELKRMDDLKMDEPHNTPYSFYYFDQGENANVLNLIQNHSGGMRLLAGKPPFDFLFVIHNSIFEDRLNQMISKIRAINGIVSIFELTESGYKELPHILECVEVHEFVILRS